MCKQVLRTALLLLWSTAAAAASTGETPAACVPPTFHGAFPITITGPLTTGSTVTASWSYDAGTPTKQTVSGEEIGQGVPIDASSTSYSYVVHQTGSHTFILFSANDCNTASASFTFQVSEPCTVPSSDITVPNKIEADSTFTATMPPGAARYSWSVFHGTLLSGQGTAAATIHVTVGAGDYVTIFGTAYGTSSGNGCSTHSDVLLRVAYPPPTISATLDPDTIPPGGSTTATIICTNCSEGHLGTDQLISPNYGEFVGSGTFTFKVTDIRGPGDYQSLAFGRSMNADEDPALQPVVLHVSATAPNPPPKITNVTPGQAPPGATIQIYGSGFVAAPTSGSTLMSGSVAPNVRIGGINAEVLSVTPTTIQAVVPQLAFGPVTVEVILSDGRTSGSIAKVFTIGELLPRRRSVRH